MKQMEMPFLVDLPKAVYVGQETIDSFCTYRDAVIWAWENRRKGKGLSSPKDQALFCHHTGYTPSHLSRAINANTKSPMDLKADYIAAFDAYVGNRAVTQFLNRITRSTSMEEFQARRAA